ncbi:divisome protein SepX/GlpR [Nocardioides dilutus]
MDPSALIFVALAVAWAVYLIPKALEHHEESARSRTVDAFSHSVRVLARREPVSRREATLVAGDDPAPPSQRQLRREAGLMAKDKKRVAKLQRRNARRLAAAARIPTDPRLRRQAAARAARRRLRVVTLILAENAVVAVLAAVGIFGWVWMAVPGGILVAWLVACRLMVRRERAELPIVRRTRTSDPVAEPVVHDGDDATQGIPVVAEATPPRDPDAWDPVPVTLPTYVSKPVATRSVRTIDLDSTGVWTSGRSEADSALVRESGEAAQTREADEGEQRALGS